VIGSLRKSPDAEQWRCPGCVENALEPEIAMADANASLSARRSSAPKLARDLLPSQRGAIKPDSHSVFNHLIVDDDPMDGSRLLRKRKTSSAEAEDRPVSPLKRRRKTGSDGSSHAILEGDTPAIPEENKDSMQIDGAGDEKPGPTAPRPSRSLRLKTSVVPRVVITQKGHNKLIIKLRTDPVELQNVLKKKPEPKKKRNRSTTGTRSSVAPAYIPQSYSQPFYSFHDKENDELKSKPYGGILTEAEADTSKTLPQPEDRRRFDDARQKAEEEWKLKTAAALAEQETVKKPRKVSGPASQIECINFGGWEIDTWYAAPYPEEYSRNRVLHICEFCLKYMNSEYVAWRHKLKCQAKHPPGDEIYREGSVSIFEVDGRKNPVYCQNLCLLAKLFLGSKTLYYDVEPFLFYVMTEDDDLGCHFVGYFSKEKRPSSQNNVSCILTLPIHQRKGYGNLLIDFSYLLTRVEKKSGSPEKPLSDMGLVSYRNYWRLILCYQLRDQKSPVSIIDISERTGMTADDIVSAMEGLRALVRDPITGTYALRLDYDFYQEYIQRWEDKRYVKLNPKSLVWTPYIMGRNNAALIEHGPPLNAIAPRDGEDDETKPALEPQHSMVNGDSQHGINGTENSEERKQESQPDPMDVDELSLDSLVKGITPGRVKGQGKGKMQSTETSGETPDTSPSTARFIKHSVSTTPRTNGFAGPSALIIPPTSIPPTRFEVYPPVPGTRGLSRPRPNVSASRPSAARSRSALSTSVSQNTNRRRSSTNSARRSTNRHRSGTARKRSGGTGRGPGRWPKGTKKSDFGNADSGPGLPPRLLTQRSRLVQEVRLGSDDPDDRNEDDEEDEDEEEHEETKGDISMDDDENEEEEEEGDEDSDAILYETPGRRRRDRDRDRDSARGKGKTKSKIIGLGIGKGMGKGKGKGKGKAYIKHDEDEDAEYADADVDADGEEYELVTGDIDVDAEGEDE
jgi:histone acetyltransferase SAS3